MHEGLSCSQQLKSKQPERRHQERPSRASPGPRAGLGYNLRHVGHDVGAARSRRFRVRPPCGTTASTAHCCVLCSSRRTTTGARGGDAEHRRLILPLSSERVVLRTCGVAPVVGCLRQCTHIGTCTSYAPSRWHLSLNAHRTSHVQLGITHFDPFLPAAQIPPLHMHPSPPQASLNSARRMHRPIMLSGMMRDRQFIGPEPPTRRRQPDRVRPEVDGGVDQPGPGLK